MKVWNRQSNQSCTKATYHGLGLWLVPHRGENIGKRNGFACGGSRSRTTPRVLKVVVTVRHRNVVSLCHGGERRTGHSWRPLPCSCVSCHRIEMRVREESGKVGRLEATRDQESVSHDRFPDCVHGYENKYHHEEKVRCEAVRWR